MPLCANTAQFSFKGLQIPKIMTPNLPKPAWAARSGIARPQQQASERPQQAARDWRIPMSAVPLPAGQAQARLAYSNAGILLSVRPKALLAVKWLSDSAAGAEGASSQDTQAGIPLDEMRLTLGPGTTGRMTLLMLLSAPPAVLANIGDSFRSKGVTACFVDVNTLLVGEYADVSAAVERMLAPAGTRSGPSPLPGSEEMAPAADVWLAIRREYAEANLTGKSSGGRMPEGVSGISLAMRLRENLELETMIHTANAAVADKLLANSNREVLRQLALGQAGALPAALLKSLNVEKTRHGVIMKLSMEASEIPAPLMEQLRSALRPIREVLAKAGTQPKGKPTFHGL